MPHGSCRWRAWGAYRCFHRSKPLLDHAKSGNSPEVPQELLVPAQILAVRNLTPKIKELKLQVEEHSGFTFKAGNWVDFFIDQDGVSKVGGYSMSSIPSSLPELRLAVKTSRHPPAQWCHTLAQPGKWVKLKAGGSFYFDAYEHGRHLKHLIFIAGGIGINPIFSMLQEALHDQHELRSLERITLLYSASTADEMAYRTDLMALAATHPLLDLELRVTRDETWLGARGRLNMEQLRRHLGEDKRLVYLCGPPAMTDQLVEDLQREGLAMSDLRYEKWW